MSSRQASPSRAEPEALRIGMVGLGRMGAGLVRRLVGAGIGAVVADNDPQAVEGVVDEHGAAAVDVSAAADLADLASQLGAETGRTRIVWVMVPAGVAAGVVREVASHLAAGDIVIDGGNSWYRETIDLAADLDERGVRLVDIGTSGGVHGVERGFCLMVGAEPDAVAELGPVLEALAPGVDAEARTPGRGGEPAPGEPGWLHCGPPGAGHFVKMVHNGIEYGMMAALAEGMAILERADLGRRAREDDAETVPVSDPAGYGFDFDLAGVAEVWRRGSVISSWLVDLLAASLAEDPTLEAYEGRVSDSGEGRWTAHAAIDLGVPAPVITTALQSRFFSRDLDVVAARALSALRHQFGGHVEQTPPQDS